MACAVSGRPAFIFIHIPKTGGTSFMSRRSLGIEIFNSRCAGFTLIGGHKYIRYISTKRKLVNYFKFATVRNPFDRFVSLALTRNGTESPDQFVEQILNREVRWYAIKPQITWIWDHKKKILIDHLLRYENLQCDVDALMKRLKLPTFKLGHLRKTERKRDYRSYYKKDKTIEFVEDYYKRDLETFNYSFEGRSDETFDHHQ